MKKIIFFICFFFAMAASSLAQNADDDNIVFTKVEQEAKFPNGLEGWRKFLMKTLDPNKPIKNGAPSGTYTVIIKFIVSKDGKVSDVQAETNHGFGMEAQAISAIKKSPDWLAAVQNGKPVNAYRRQPITFLVPKTNKELRTESSSNK